MIQEFYTKLSEKEKKIFYGAFFVVVLAVFDLLFFRPVTSQIKSLDEEVKEKSNSIKRDVRFLSYQEKILTEKEIYDQYKTDENLTEEEIIAGFLKTIETLASQANVNLVKLNPADVTQKKGYVEYYANLECNGHLEDIVKFMHSIDLTENLLRIVKIDMTGKKASADEVQASMKVAKLVIDSKTIGNVQFSKEDAAILHRGPSPKGAKMNQEKLPDIQSSEKGSGGDVNGTAGPLGPGGTKPPLGAGGDASQLPGDKSAGSAAATGAAGGTDNTPQDVYLGPQSQGNQPRSLQAVVDDGKSDNSGFGRVAGSAASSGSKRGVGIKSDSEENSEEKKPAQEKEKTDLQKKFEKSKEGGRVRVEGFESLVYKFFHGGKLPDEEAGDDEEETPPEDDEPNLWERKMQRK